MPISDVLIDDRLLVAQVTGGSVLARRSTAHLHTTIYWYYRACRAAVLGAAGQLSGPFADLDAARQAEAINSMLRLPDEIGLPDPRSLVPAMVEVSGRHRHLNVMNVEAAAAAIVLNARVLLSPAAAAGVLAPVLDAEDISWTIHAPS